MNREDDNLYARHQMLVALVNVLVHDLRNPLHSATLLIEAMGSPAADAAALRGKLRAQIGKLDALIAETNASMKEQTLPVDVEVVDVDAWLRLMVEHYTVVTGRAATFVLPPAAGVEVSIDRRLVELSAIEIAGVIAGRQSENGAGAPRVTVDIDEPEPGTVRVRFGELEPDFAATLAKAPFSIAGGGIHLAVARAMAQNGGATLRLEHNADSVAHFALHLKKSE
jgi:signal transduction histidine kinase